MNRGLLITVRKAEGLAIIVGAAILVRVILVTTAWLVTHDVHVFYYPDSGSYIARP